MRKSFLTRFTSIILSSVLLLGALGAAVTSFAAVENEEAIDSTYNKNIPAPKMLKIENGIEGIRIYWENVPNANEYMVYRRGVGEELTLVARVNKPDYLDESVKENSCEYYRYTVRAVVNNQYGDYENGLFIKRMDIPVVDVIENSLQGISVSWTPVKNADGYRVYRREAGKSWVYLETVKSENYLDVATKNHTGEYYRYTVRAVVNGFFSSFTNGLYIKRIDAPYMSSIKNAAEGISISWHGIKGATSYNIFRRGVGESYQFIESTNKNSFIDDSVKAHTNKYYRYTVTAKINGAESAYDNGLYIRRIDAPHVEKAVNTVEGINLTWTAVPESSAYRIYRKTNNSSWRYLDTTSETSFLDKDVKYYNGEKYIYTVRAIVNGIYSGFEDGKAIERVTTYPSSKIITRTRPETYRSILSNMSKLQQRYPTLLKMCTLGYAESGVKIPMFKMGKGNRTALVIAGIHAREHLSTKYMMCCIEDYCSAYNSRSGKLGSYNIKELLNKYTLYVVPCANPDGLEIVLNHIKPVKGVVVNDLTEYKANYNGVDLNRNFPVSWDNITNGIDYPNEQLYKGPTGGSESESKALMKLCKNNKFDFMLSFHVRGNCIFWGDVFKTTHNGLYRAFAQDIARGAEFSMTQPTTNPSSYGGGFENWFRHNFNKPGLCIELVKLNYTIVPCHNTNYKIFNDVVNYNHSKYAIAEAMKTKNK